MQLKNTPLKRRKYDRTGDPGYLQSRRAKNDC
jgi:hypothetical protein